MTPPTVESEDAEKEAVLEAARLMLVAARTAPKTAGKDDILTLMIFGKERDAIADVMEQIAVDRNAEGFRRDARNVRDSVAVILIGVRGNKSVGLDCGGCGYNDCQEFKKATKKLGKDFVGSTCILKALDMGISLGSAVKVASIFNVDNRIMYRVGTAAVKLKLLPEATIVMGIPLSAKGKSIYFDRLK